MTQADALAMLVAVNEHEIAAADQAMQNVTGKVHEYAQLMEGPTRQNLVATTRLGGAASTAPAVTRLHDQGEDDLAALDTQNGKAYEKAYVDAMVRGHADALALIDSHPDACRHRREGAPPPHRHAGDGREPSGAGKALQAKKQ